MEAILLCPGVMEKRYHEIYLKINTTDTALFKQ